MRVAATTDEATGAKAKGRGTKRKRGAAARLGGDEGDWPAAAAGGGTGGHDEDALFEELRALRREIADREGVPAYVIFHDATLREMAASRPRTPEDLLDVGGVGEKKLEKYGEEFLAALRSG